MSEYQKLKARALAAQQEREREIQNELERKAEKVKQQRQQEEEKRKRQEAASRDARTLELKRANEAINKGKLEALALAEQKKHEYNPFAEPERRPTPSSSSSSSYIKEKPKAGTTKSAPPKNGTAPRTKSDIPRPPLIGTTGQGSRPKKPKESSPPALGRKEKAARALLESAKRSGGSGSIFSVRSNLPKNGSSSSLPYGSAGGSSKPKSKVGVTKGRGDGAVPIGDLRQLAPGRGTRDDRSIDQIQRDIKARKAATANGSAPAGKKSSRSSSPDKKVGASRSLVGNGRSPIATTASSHRRRQPSPTPSTSSSTSESDDSRSRGQKRKRPPPAGPGREGTDKINVSAMIQDIFRRPNRPAIRPVYSDDESDAESDMEAGLSDVEQEERRAIMIARREDELAEREERERKARKEKLRKERERGGV